MAASDVGRAGVSLGTSMSAVSAEPPNAPQVDVEDDVPRDAKGGRHPSRRLELDGVALAVAEAQGVELEPLLPGNGAGGGGIHAPRQQQNGTTARHAVILTG